MFISIHLPEPNILQMNISTSPLYGTGAHCRILRVHSPYSHGALSPTLWARVSHYCSFIRARPGFGPGLGCFPCFHLNACFRRARDTSIFKPTCFQSWPIQTPLDLPPQ